MYSPKIREDLIPRIHQKARKARVPMTTWVNQAVEQALALRDEPQISQSQETKEKINNE